MAVEEHKLYDGEVVVRFDPVRHIYRVKGKWIPGATSISGFMDNGKCEGLKRWAVKMALNYMNTQLVAGKSYDEIDLAEMFEQARNEPFKRTKAAANIGNVAHEYVEKLIQYRLDQGKKPKRPVNEQALSAVLGFEKWETEHKVEYVEAERKVVSLEHWYAGTTDIIAYVDGELVVGDIKTSNYLSAEHLLQVAGYQIALEEEFEDPFQNRWILHLHKEDGDFTAYNLNEMAGETVKFTPWMKINFHTAEEDKATFLALRAAFRGVRNG
jgi:CRISPR/Cas system-associated exonuclease Cas4 (RecB family)